MKKVTALTMGVILLSTGLVFAQDASQPTQPAMAQASDTTKLVEVGNKICPVSGNKVGEMGPAVKYTYNGKIYNLCCGMCPKTFKKDPAKYSKIAEDEVSKS